jgi:uncharacterized paraquat-inducible protein A
MSQQAGDATGSVRFGLVCLHCERTMLAREEWVGWEVMCPYCQAPLRVPDVPIAGRAARGTRPKSGPKKVFNFPCPRCECLLEANTGMSGQTGTCPTCAAHFHVPYVSRWGDPDAATLVDHEVTTPTPLHAYAASGHQAPEFVRGPDGLHAIQCPRCRAHNSLDADSCHACQTPFTMEAAPSTQSIRRRGANSAAAVLGVVSLFLFPLFIPALMAIALGLSAVISPAMGGKLWGAATGIVLGICSMASGVLFWVLR